MTPKSGVSFVEDSKGKMKTYSKTKIHHLEFRGMMIQKKKNYVEIPFRELTYLGKKTSSKVPAGRGMLHPTRLAWNLQISHLERKMIFQTSTIMFHVDLQGCSSQLTNQL